jgi:hypothetical protein
MQFEEATMTDPKMNLREMICFVAERLMDMDFAAGTDAAYGNKALVIGRSLSRFARRVFIYPLGPATLRMVHSSW